MVDPADYCRRCRRGTDPHRRCRPHGALCGQRRAHPRRHRARAGSRHRQARFAVGGLGDAQMQAALEQRGMPASAVASMVDLGRSIQNGALRQDYDRHRPATLGRVKLEDFAREFAAAFSKA
ncbi:MAG: hypothetical protein WKG07_38800 [Hymenobacter sp.]